MITMPRTRPRYSQGTIVSFNSPTNANVQQDGGTTTIPVVLQYPGPALSDRVLVTQIGTAAFGNRLH